MSIKHPSTGESEATENAITSPLPLDELLPHSATQRQRQSPEQSDQAEVMKPRNMRTSLWICLVISLLSSMFLFALDNTVLADVQPSIIHTFDNIDKLPWVSVSYALGAISVNLFVSKLFSQFDNKIIFIAGVIIFETGSALCGGAPGISALIVGRVICGIGGVGIYVGAMNLLSALTTETERPIYLSFVGLTWGLGTVLGPIVGGALADSPATWRWAFYLNLCVGAVVGPVYIFLLPSFNPRPGLSITSRIRELDFVGAVLNAGAFVTFVMPLAFGGGVFAWNSGQIIGLFVCTAVLWILFIVQQALVLFTTENNRLFPVAFLKSWEMNILFAQIAAGVVVVYIPIFFIPLYYQFIQNESALQAGVRLLPLIFLEVFGVILNGAMMGKLGYYMPWYLVGGILSIISGALLHTVNVNTSNSAIYGYGILVGLGCGFYVQASYPIAQVKVERKLIAPAIAFIGCGQITGITLALAISNSIFLNQATNKISKILPLTPRPIIQQAISGTRGTFFDTLDPLDRREVLDALAQCISNVYYMVIAAGAVTVVLSLFMKREKLFLEPNSNNLENGGALQNSEEKMVKE